jgi:hypothetical protein
VRHVLVLGAARRRDLAGSSIVFGYRLVSMTLVIYLLRMVSKPNTYITLL